MPPLTPGEGAEHPFPELLQLGQQLRQARERAGVSPEELAGRLRMAPRQLQALEEGDHARLPEGVFIVALARRVAGALQADLEEAILAVRQSRLLRREVPAKTTPPAALVQRDPPQTPPRRPISWRWPLLAAALLATAGIAVAWRLSSQQDTSGPATAPSRPNPEPAPSSRVPAPRPAALSPSPPAAAEANSLRLIAREASWIEVRTVDGRRLFEGTLTGEKRFPLGQGVEVIAGRPHAVTAAIGPAPGTPLGGVADIRWKRFSPPGLTPPSPASATPSP
ncbi:MAG: RodZ domain-containing protein [Cyanobacteriota bacterium]|nr:RodZ domain-containing protein [Cyanobacteriota bacterium]